MFARTPSKAQTPPPPMIATPEPAFNAAPRPNIHPVATSVVGPDLIMEGSIAGDVELHVEGAVRGDIHVTRLIVGEKGHVEGRVRAQAIESHGRVIGDVEGLKVKLFESAYVKGDILHEQLSIEPGAFFQGVCRQPTAQAPHQSQGPFANPAPTPQPAPAPQVQPAAQFASQPAQQFAPQNTPQDTSMPCDWDKAS